MAIFFLFCSVLLFFYKNLHFQSSDLQNLWILHAAHCLTRISNRTILSYFLSAHYLYVTNQRKLQNSVSSINSHIDALSCKVIRRHPAVYLAWKSIIVAIDSKLGRYALLICATDMHYWYAILICSAEFNRWTLLESAKSRIIPVALVSCNGVKLSDSASICFVQLKLVSH